MEKYNFKKHKLQIVILLFFLFCFAIESNVYSQCDAWKRNLIHNAGFEDGDVNEPDKPDGYAQFEYVDVWEQDMEEKP